MSRHSKIKPRKRHYKVIIAVPSGAQWASEFGVSLAIMMAYISQTKIAIDAATQHVLINNVKGSILPQMRQQMVDYAIKEKATHMLFVDSDMVFPRDTLHQLMAWNQMVVAANCCTKMMPSSPTARVDPEKKVGGIPVSSMGKTGLKRVWRVGTGVMLINMRAFERIERPFFSLKWGGDIVDQYVGEDWALCQKFEEANVPIFIDHGLSRDIGHMGTFNYNMNCLVSPEEEEKVRKALTG